MINLNSKDQYDDSSEAYSLQYIDVIRLAQRSGPISMKLLMRTRKFIGVISIGRLILYREDKSNIHEKIYDTDIKLQGQDRKVDVNPDSKNDKRLNLTVVSEVDGKRKYETYEVRVIFLLTCLNMISHNSNNSIIISSNACVK